MAMPILALPTDVLILVLLYLPVAELSAFSRTCKFLDELVTHYGWTSYLRANRRPSFSLSKAQAHWTPHMRVRYDAQADRSWSRSRFVARPLSAPWRGKLQPAMAISPSRLIVAAGSNIYSYRFDIPATANDAPPIQFEGVCNLSEPGQPRRDVTAVAFIPDGGLDLTICVGFQNGALERLSMHPSKNASIPIMTKRCIIEGELKQHDLVESFSSDGNHLLALSSNGVASLSDTSSPFLPPALINLQTRSWTTHLSMRAPTPYAAFGTSSATPLKLHHISADAFSTNPSAILYANNDHLAHNSLHSAVYGITNGPPSSPWGFSPQIIVSGWYDGFVRVHDLRSSSRATTSGHQDPAPLLPVLSMCDPTSYEPIYDVSCGGGSASHVAAGSARHSVVSFWDVRSPMLGWSVHAPGNDLSPVYHVILESSRMFGTTQSRPFVYDFGPGLTTDTYPSLPQGRVDGLKHKKNWDGISYYVTHYSHRSCKYIT